MVNLCDPKIYKDPNTVKDIPFCNGTCTAIPINSSTKSEPSSTGTWVKARFASGANQAADNLVAAALVTGALTAVGAAYAYCSGQSNRDGKNRDGSNVGSREPDGYA